MAESSLLALDASTAHASVAVVRGTQVLAERHATMRAGADDALMPAIDAALTAAGVRVNDVAAVVCGAGPGGFTSLRISAAIAKGIAHASACALVAVPSLALAAAGRAARAARGRDGESAWLVTLDALRGERYAARVTTVRVGDRVVVTGYVYLGVLTAEALVAARDAVSATSVDANVETPRASAVTAFALRAHGEGPGNRAGGLVLAPVDLDGWEPNYGRQAEAQARWELTHGRALASALARESAVPGARDAGGR